MTREQGRANGWDETVGRSDGWTVGMTGIELEVFIDLKGFPPASPLCPSLPLQVRSQSQVRGSQFGTEGTRASSIVQSVNLARRQYNGSRRQFRDGDAMRMETDTPSSLS